MANQSPIHAPLDSAPNSPFVPSRISLLASLDNRDLAGRRHSLGAGGASALFNRAVEKALVDEMAEQLRCGARRGTVCADDGAVAMWAAEIIKAFTSGEG